MIPKLHGTYIKYVLCTVMYIANCVYIYVYVQCILCLSEIYTTYLCTCVFACVLCGYVCGCGFGVHLSWFALVMDEVCVRVCVCACVYACVRVYVCVCAVFVCVYNFFIYCLFCVFSLLYFFGSSGCIFMS